MNVPMTIYLPNHGERRAGSLSPAGGEGGGEGAWARPGASMLDRRCAATLTPALSRKRERGQFTEHA